MNKLQMETIWTQKSLHAYCRVFLEEACDDLGGEFCEAEYQKGVSVEKTETR